MTHGKALLNLVNQSSRTFNVRRGGRVLQSSFHTEIFPPTAGKIGIEIDKNIFFKETRNISVP